jgi:hypothetical protein
LLAFEEIRRAVPRANNREPPVIEILSCLCESVEQDVLRLVINLWIDLGRNTHHQAIPAPAKAASTSSNTFFFIL